MIEEHARAEIDKYYQLLHSERTLDRMYQREMDDWEVRELDSDDEEETDGAPDRYVVASTGATLTSHAAIALLNYLCSIYPRDDFCGPIKPEYTVEQTGGGFAAKVKLPSALPLSQYDLEFHGPIRPSRKGAKRAAAFRAARRLHELKVFDDNLLPGRLQRGDGAVDADEQPVTDTFDIPKIMDGKVLDRNGQSKA